MSPTLTKNTRKERRYGLKATLLLESRKYGCFCGPCLILSDRGLLEEALADDGIGELIFWVISRPGKEICHAFRWLVFGTCLL